MKQQANKTKKINMTIDFAAPIEDKMQTCIIPAFLYYITNSLGRVITFRRSYQILLEPSKRFCVCPLIM